SEHATARKSRTARQSLHRPHSVTRRVESSPMRKRVRVVAAHAWRTGIGMVTLRVVRGVAARGVVMREVFAYLTILGITGCTHATTTSAPRFGALVADERQTVNVRDKIAYPTGDCLARAKQFVGDEAELIRTPLPPDMRARVERVLDGLHPVAKRVLARTS